MRYKINNNKTQLMKPKHQMSLWSKTKIKQYYISKILNSGSKPYLIIFSCNTVIVVSLDNLDCSVSTAKRRLSEILAVILQEYYETFMKLFAIDSVSS